MRIVWLDRTTFADAVEVTRPAFSHDREEFATTRRDDMVPKLEDADIAIVNKVGSVEQPVD